MPFPEVKRTIYKKNVLDQVMCQLKFPPILRIDAELPVAFQEHVNREFPNYSEKTNWRLEWSLGAKEPSRSQLDTRMQPTDSMKNHEFSTEDGQWKINLTRTFLALTTDSYSVWEDFKRRLDIPLKAFISVYSPSHFSRIGLRYKNVIKRSALELDGVDWSKLLKPQVLGILADSETSQNVRDLQSVCEISLPDIDSAVRVSTRLTRDRGTDEICYVIDSDFFNAQKTPIDTALSGFDDFNQHASRLMSYIQDFVHETDSGIVSSLFPEDEFSDLNELGDKDQTYGGHVDLRFPPLPVQDLIIRAWTTVATVKDDTTANECRRILQIIAESILFFQTQGFDLGHLPRLHAFDLEDGSLLIEWIFDDFRIGFGVEPIPSESSWYLVSNARLENINQAGDIPQNELETQDLMLRLVNFVVSNS